MGMRGPNKRIAVTNSLLKADRALERSSGTPLRSGAPCFSEGLLTI